MFRCYNIFLWLMIYLSLFGMPQRCLLNIRTLQCFVRDYTIKLLSSSFPNMTPVEVAKFVDGLFSSKADPPNFKNHIRDFLVQSKEFSAQGTNSSHASSKAIDSNTHGRECGANIADGDCFVNLDSNTISAHGVYNLFCVN